MDALPARHFDTTGKSPISLSSLLAKNISLNLTGKSPAPFHHRAICKTAHTAAHRAPGAMTGRKFRQLKLHRLATANDRLRVATGRFSKRRV